MPKQRKKPHPPKIINPTILLRSTHYILIGKKHIICYIIDKDTCVRKYFFPIRFIKRMLPGGICLYFPMYPTKITLIKEKGELLLTNVVGDSLTFPITAVEAILDSNTEELLWSKP